VNATAEALLLLSALAVALALRPWRLLRGGPGGGANPLLTPLLALLVLLPWLWALPRLHTMPLQLSLSGACLATLMLGWPLAVLALGAVAAISTLLAPQDLPGLLGQALWLGVAPATFALAIGVGLRRLSGHRPFVYILGRAFIGTALALFAAGALAQWSGHELAHVSPGLSLVARWLMAWGDAFATGMLTAIFVAYKPQWLATWSDRLYLRRPEGEERPGAS
jgi:uncharacterized membrane protein